MQLARDGGFENIKLHEQKGKQNMNISQELKDKYGPNICGQVIRILNNHTVIVNLGSNNDISIGATFLIYEYLGNLIAPDGDNLGPLEYVKAKVEVVRCEQLYSICQTEKVYSNALTLSPLLENKHYTFPVDQEEISPMSPTDRNVHVGDPVKLFELSKK